MKVILGLGDVAETRQEPALATRLVGLLRTPRRDAVEGDAIRMVHQVPAEGPDELASPLSGRSSGVQQQASRLQGRSAQHDRAAHDLMAVPGVPVDGADPVARSPPDPTSTRSAIVSANSVTRPVRGRPQAPRRLATHRRGLLHDASRPAMLYRLLQCAFRGDQRNAPYAEEVLNALVGRCEIAAEMGQSSPTPSPGGGLELVVLHARRMPAHTCSRPPT